MKKAAQLTAPVYMLSVYQLDTLLTERVGGVHSVLVVFFPADLLFQQNRSSLVSFTEVMGLVLSYKTTISRSIFLK